MRYSYLEFYQKLTEVLSNYDVILGTNVKEISNDTCFITHLGSDLTYSDDEPKILSSKYELTILQDYAGFTNSDFVKLTDEGVRFVAYDDESGKNVFSATVTLFGENSLPVEE